MYMYDIHIYQPSISYLVVVHSHESHPVLQREMGQIGPQGAEHDRQVEVTGQLPHQDGPDKGGGEGEHPEQFLGERHRGVELLQGLLQKAKKKKG